MTTAAAWGNEMPLPPGYPAPWEFHGLLTHGQAVLVRPIRPADADLLVNFHANLTPDTANWRHFGIHPTITPGEAAHRAEVDYGSRMAFVALVADDIVAIGSYERLGPTNPAAGVSFTVADEYQRHGIATLLFESLAAYERFKGRIKADPDATANFARARAARVILREERNFVEVVDGTFGLPSTLAGPA